MRRERGSLLQNILLGPVASIVLAIAGLSAMIASGTGHWLTGLISAAIGAFGVYQIKGRGLFKGPNFPFIGLFLILQAAALPGFTSTMLALLALVATVGIMLCFQQPDQTRLIYLITLVCGFGALGARCFLLLAGALIIELMFVRAFSMRGFVASVLGLLTPLIILAGFGIYDPMHLVGLYGSRWFVDINAPALITAIPAVIFALSMFLTVYGYPAKQRARNLAIMSLTGSAIIMAMVDSANGDHYMALINLLSAYWVNHFAATHRFGWTVILLTIAFAIAYGCYY